MTEIEKQDRTGGVRLPQDIRRVDLTREELDRLLIVGFDSSDSRSRPFNLLRTQLAKLLSAKEWGMIGLSSATPSAGKTFTSVNLAAAMSRTEDRPIILCDLDMRRGSISRHIGVSTGSTLDDYLRGDLDDWRESLFTINYDNLVVLPTKASNLQSSELLAGERFQRLMGDLRELSRDHLVLCDLPPVFANDDAMLTAKYLDAYIFIVDHGRTTSRQVEESLALMAPTPCVGTVINRYNGGLVDDYGYGYGDPYGLRDYGNAEGDTRRT